ncbi:hypothetical protein [Prevotella sp. KH2C16]|uniref:hypothetical protein n=1 Tax=Prevotella sp. KH2C16 TaxID=1855325 RepID=UPI0008F0BE7C|nr:hypothetical protein [Prevotella sp. KH2C16]SFG16453.1 hypothetical protein SAMN05216383_10661 [Prevotella sp. KH2C16]
MQKRLQNKIAESRMALPLTLVYTVAVGLAGGVAERRLWLPFGCLLLGSLLMVQLNNANALIRIYSRMVSCSFAVLSTAAFFLSPGIEESVVSLCVIAAYFFLFGSYQDRRSMGRIFYAFLFIGIASTVFVQMLFFIPFLWILAAVNILSLSWRNFWASILGLVFPYWFVGGFYVYTGQMDVFLNHFVQLADFEWFMNYGVTTWAQLITFVYVSLLGLTGSIHFLRNSFLDKIRTRMLFEFFITMEALTAAFMVIAPVYYDFLLCILIVNTAPLIGHFIALTKTRLTNIAFCLICASAVALTVCNLLEIWNILLIS